MYCHACYLVKLSQDAAPKVPLVIDDKAASYEKLLVYLAFMASSASSYW